MQIVQSLLQFEFDFPAKVSFLLSSFVSDLNLRAKNYDSWQEETAPVWSERNWAENHEAC